MCPTVYCQYFLMARAVCTRVSPKPTLWHVGGLLFSTLFSPWPCRIASLLARKNISLQHDHWWPSNRDICFFHSSVFLRTVIIIGAPGLSAIMSHVATGYRYSYVQSHLIQLSPDYEVIQLFEGSRHETVPSGSLDCVF